MPSRPPDSAAASEPPPPPPDADADGIAAPADDDPMAAQPLFWNGWLSDSAAPNLAPVGSLAADLDYVLTLDLSGIDYGQFFDSKVQTSSPSDAVKGKLSEDMGGSRFEVLLLADPVYFERVKPHPWEGDLQASLSKIHAYAGEVGASPFDSGASTQPAYRFGRVQFRLRVKRASKYPVRTRLGLSIWNKDRPIDAVEVPVCIQRGGDAAPKNLCETSQRSIAPAHWSSFDDAPPADASLQLVGQGDERIWSVFRKKQEPLKSAIKWTVSRTGELAVRQSIESSLKAMEKAKSERLPALGANLLGALFPKKAIAERKVVESALSALIREPPAGGGRPRLLLKTSSSTVIPLGLAAVPVGNDLEFLGRRFAIEAPLAEPGRPASGANSCNLSWISVLPPDLSVSQGADETMAAVRARLAQRSGDLLRRWDTPSSSSCAFSNMEEFGDWMARGESASTRTGLLVVSHHGAEPGKNSLFFATDQSDGILPSMMRRPFGAGSLAILNACGTGGASALGFVEALSELGFQSIIATATEVQAPLAADFTYCLASQVTDKPVPLGVAFDAAIQCLSELDDGVYGPRALTYTLLGDRENTICAQPKDVPCTNYQ